MTEDLATFFDAGPDGFAESVTLAGVALTAIVDMGTELALGEVLQSSTSLLVPAAAAPAAAEGQACVVRSVNYVVRQVLQEPPDGALLRLVLART